jgi:FixJ family two-component response regulator
MINQRIIIVDDEPVILNGLRDLLSNNYETLFFTSAEEFLAAFSNFDFEDGKPSCILLDFQMPGMNGIELQISLQQMNVEFPIIFMSGNAQQRDIINAWHEGAKDFILKPFTADQILEVISNQFTSLPKSLNERIASLQFKKTFKISISKREAQVLLLLGKGLPQQEVSKRLGITLRTVKMHRSHLKDKLNLNTLIELARFYDLHQEQIKQIANN